MLKVKTNPEYSRAYSREYYKRNKDRMDRQSRAARLIRWNVHKNTLMERKDVPCADCGGRFPTVAMDFDHVRGVKRRDVAAMGSYSAEVRAVEIAKCEVVCANCHRVRTNRRKTGA